MPYVEVRGHFIRTNTHTHTDDRSRHPDHCFIGRQLAAGVTQRHPNKPCRTLTVGRHDPRTASRYIETFDASKHH